MPALLSQCLYVNLRPLQTLKKSLYLITKVLQLPTQYEYNKAFPPSVKIKDQFGESFQQLVIPAEITIQDILEISDSKLSVVFMLRMSWHDSHLVFNYLKDEALYNELDEVTVERVWMPEPQFAFLYNGLQEIFTELNSAGYENILDILSRFVLRCVYDIIPDSSDYIRATEYP